MKKKLCIIIITLAIIRIILGTLIGVWFAPSQSLDDALLANYSILPLHYLSPNVFSLVKTMSYPIFMNLNYITGLKYSTLVSLLWVIDALFVARIIYKITKKTILSFFSYVYVLFYPMAFELWLGTRLYRNSIIAPFVLLIICFILRKIYSLNENLNIKKECAMQFLLGVIFSFTFYIKEDGIWLLLCLIFSMFIELIKLVKINRKKKISKKRIINLSIMFLLPIIIFVLYTNAYKIVNYKFFKVYEIETKSKGEIGKFVNNIYKIDSKNRTSVYWAPKDAIEKAYSVSKTFQKYPQLLDNIIHTEWFAGDIENIPIRGDFLTWVLRTSLNNKKIWKSETQVNKLFGKINKEIDIAFKKNKLKKAKRIQIISSAGGRTPREITRLSKLVLKSFRDTILLNGYNPGAQYNDSNNELTTIYYSAILREKNLTKDNRNIKEINTLNSIIKIIFAIYKILNVILALTLVLNLLINSKKFVKKICKKDIDIFSIKYFLTLILTLIAIAYSFSISWFTEFLYIDGYSDTTQNFYVIALPVLLIFPYILSADLVGDKVSFMKKIKNNKLLMQILKFLVVGVVATIIDWVVYYLLYNLLKINPLIANIGAFSISVVYNYIASVKWVFDVNSKKSKKQMFTEFMILSIIGLLITEGIIYLGTDILKIDAMVIKIIATGVVMVFNFITRKIFLERKDK